MADNLKITLKLKGSSGELYIPCGNIESLDANLHSYGFECTVQFMVGDKDLKGVNIDFLYDLPAIEATVTITPNYAAPELKPIELKGIVWCSDLIREETFSQSNSLPVLKRVFRVEIKDPAQEMWSQHFPSRLYTEKSMEEVITDNKSGSIPIKFEFDELKKKHPLIAIGLGYKNNAASFYSFLMWYLEESNGIWSYDYEEKTYVISDKKKEDGDPINIPAEGSVVVNFLRQLRSKVRVLNSFAPDPRIKELERKEAYEKVTRDYLMTTEMLTDFETKVKQVQPIPDLNRHELQVSFRTLPRMKMLPGDLVSFNSSTWSAKAFYKTKIYRIRDLRINMNAASSNFMEGSDAPDQIFGGSIYANLELKEEKGVKRPPYTAPTYPFFADGKIVSEVGTKEELTFQIDKHPETSQKRYIVEIPLWEYKRVKAPFEPLSNHSQFYFPLLKGDEVWVAFDLFHAKIAAVNKYGEKAQWPFDKQGNRIIFAPKKEKASTVLEHSEEDGLLVWTLVRTSDGKIQTIQLKEDGLHLRISEEGKSDPKSLVHMDNDHTITLTTQDIDAEALHTVKLMMGEISTLCKKGGDTSTFIQTPKKIAIQCEEFELFTKKSNFISEEETNFTADSVTIEGENGVNIITSVTAEIEGKTINIKGKSTTIEGDPIKLG